MHSTFIQTGARGVVPAAPVQLQNSNIYDSIRRHGERTHSLHGTSFGFSPPTMLSAILSNHCFSSLWRNYIKYIRLIIKKAPTHSLQSACRTALTRSNGRDDEHSTPAMLPSAPQSQTRTSWMSENAHNRYKM